jgi:hypothetical protein
MFSQLVYGASLKPVLQMFDLNSEGNFPTLYQVGALITTSMLLFFVGMIKKRQRDKYAIHWMVLGGIFFLMSYDEASQMHERLNAVTRSFLPESSMDFLFFAWVIPYAILALTIGFIYIRFLMNLPKRTAILFIIAGAIFVTGAIGLEMVTSYYRGVVLVIHMVVTIEETLEMLGIVFFIYAILDYIKNNIGANINLVVNQNIDQHNKGTQKKEIRNNVNEKALDVL